MKPISIGVPLPNYACCLLDEDTGQPTSDNTGELCIAGPGVSLGYLGRDELTKEKFTEYGYRTGDRVTFDSGRILFQQRIDSQVKVPGFPYRTRRDRARIACLDRHGSVRYRSASQRTDHCLRCRSIERIEHA